MTKRKHKIRLQRLRAGRDPQLGQHGRALIEATLFPRAREAYLVPSHWLSSEEVVHDTRVGTRRLVEALDFCAPLLGTDTVRRLRKDAKRLRRALGARREADVLIADFRELVLRTEVSGESARQVAEALNRMGRDGARRAARRYSPKTLEKLGRRLVAAVDAVEPPSADWRDLGGPHLYQRSIAPEPRLALLDDDGAVEAHHDLRLDFKRLRYAAELLAPVFPDQLAEVGLRDLKRVQDALGALQDAQDLLAFLDREVVRDAVVPDARARLADLAQSRIDERLARARGVVAATGVEVLGALRRTAGKIGQLEAA